MANFGDLKLKLFQGHLWAVSNNWPSIATGINFRGAVGSMLIHIYMAPSNVL
jgi:hypothetical protein